LGQIFLDFVLGHAGQDAENGPRWSSGSSVTGRYHHHGHGGHEHAELFTHGLDGLNRGGHGGMVCF
jgi:hypothetical protein